MSQDPTTDTGAAATHATVVDLTATRLPGYEILEEVGRGGMGVVYRAHDTVIERDVAIKVLTERYSAESGAARRFLTESRITGQLQHPGIPAVHQVGRLPDGRPFLAMKLIKGRTLEEMLKGAGDSPIDRGRLLAVFESVCQAVGYAHAHRVIHRDLKPANVMVGAFGEVQVMDWGLAKFLGETPAVPAETVATEQTMAWTEISPMPDDSKTMAGSLLGTPAYVSPEQAAGEIGKVDERSDVFGLGAILAVILTGKPPYIGENVESVRVMAVRGRLEDCLARLAVCQAEPELIALCKRCLAFEPNDRPRDAGEVAQAVAALRAASNERARQAEVDRERAAVRAAEEHKRRTLMHGATAAIAVVLAIGAGVSLWQMTRANSAAADAKIAEDKAKKAELAAREAESKALEREKQEKTARETSEAIATFMRDVFVQGSAYGQATTTRGINRELTVKEAMKYAADRIEGRFKSRPDLEAAVRGQIGETFFQLNAFAEAALQFEKAAAIAEKLEGPEHGKVHLHISSLAVVRQLQGDYPTAKRLFSKALEGAEKDFGAEHIETLRTMNNYAILLQEMQEYSAAEPLYRRALEGRERTLGPDHVDTLVSLNSLGYFYRAQNKLAEVEPLLKRALTGNEKAHGPDHPDTITIVHNLASLYSAMKNYGAAEPMYRRALAGFEKAFGPVHPHTLHCVNSMADLYKNKGDIAAAEAHYRRAISGSQKEQGPDHPMTLRRVANLASLYFAEKRFREAVPLYKEAVQGFEKRHDDDAYVVAARAGLGLSLLGDGQKAEAEGALLKAYETATKQKPSDSVNRWVRKATQGLVDLYTSTNQAAKAAEWRAKLATLPPEAPEASKTAK